MRANHLNLDATMDVENYINPSAFDKLFSRNLPHVLEKIFLSLDYRSFLNSLDVCRSWNELIISDSFKKKATLLFREEMEDEIWKAIWRGNTKEARRHLSCANVDVNHIERSYMTPLCYAGHKKMVQLLLDAGADANKPTRRGLYPLDTAILHQNFKVAKLLVDRGADIKKIKYESFGPDGRKMIDILTKGRYRSPTQKKQQLKLQLLRRQRRGRHGQPSSKRNWKLRRQVPAGSSFEDCDC